MGIVLILQLSHRLENTEQIILSRFLLSHLAKPLPSCVAMPAEQTQREACELCD